MFLIIGLPTDSCCQFVIEELRRRGRHALFLDESKVFPDLCGWIQIEGIPSGNVRGSLGLSELRTTAPDAVLLRTKGRPQWRISNAEDLSYLWAEWEAFIQAWSVSQTCTVINRRRPEFWTRVYLDVLAIPVEIVSRFHLFSIPRFLVSNRCSEIRRFLESCSRGVFLEQTTDDRRRPVSAADMTALTLLAKKAPLCLRETRVGMLVDVFVVGDWTMCTPDVLPEQVREECVRITAAMGMVFVRIEVEKDDDIQYFLGVDLMPSLDELSSDAQCRIVSRVTDFLTVGA